MLLNVYSSNFALVILVIQFIEDVLVKTASTAFEYQIRIRIQREYVYILRSQIYLCLEGKL